MKTRGVVNTSVSMLIPHPDNPRKDLGDLSELTESVRKNGILQNLTVVPIDKDGNSIDADHAYRYMVIIGHRRLSAAKAAGIDYVPCRIVEGMTHEEQILTMLEENMQRSDLTVFDQAQSFQMMLDLGQTVEDIEEKSGFSKTTIYHRLNIAKLDKETLKEKQDDMAFQLSITDLIELEKVKDIEKRNEILAKSRNSSELKYLANQNAQEEAKAAAIEAITKALEEMGLTKLPNGVYGYQCEKLHVIKFKETQEIDFELEDNAAYYEVGWEVVTIYAPKNETKEVEADPRQQAYEIMQEKRKEIKLLGDQFIARRRDTLKEIAAGKLEPVNKEIAGKSLWQAVMQVGTTVELEEMAKSWLAIQGIDPDASEDPDEAADIVDTARTQVFEMPFDKQCALALLDAWLRSPANEYTGEHDFETIEGYKVLDKALMNYGFIPPKEEEKALMDVNSDLLTSYRQAKKEYSGKQ